MTKRTCGECSLCCKLFDLPIPELNNKPRNKWCPHCQPSNGGCMIYKDRPDVCRNYECNWLQGNFGDHWYPAKSGVVISYDGETIELRVDPDRASDWIQSFNKEPYRTDIMWMIQNYGFRIVIGDWVKEILPPHEREGKSHSEIIETFTLPPL